MSYDADNDRRDEYWDDWSPSDEEACIEEQQQELIESYEIELITLDKLIREWKKFKGEDRFFRYWSWDRFVRDLEMTAAGEEWANNGIVGLNLSILVSSKQFYRYTVKRLLKYDSEEDPAEVIAHLEEAGCVPEAILAIQEVCGIAPN